MRILISLFVFVLFSITNLEASTFNIVEITRDDSSLTYRLIVDSEDESIIDQVRKETHLNGKLINNEILNPNELKKGIVLEEQRGFQVLVLRSSNFDMVHGGSVQVDTLYSGVTGERRSTYFDLAKHHYYHNISLLTNLYSTFSYRLLNQRPVFFHSLMPKNKRSFRQDIIRSMDQFYH